MRDLELWLEAASESCALPPNCYAAVRSAKSGPHKPLTSCTPNEATCLGDIDPDEGPIVVEIFQRVGSINIGPPQPGAQAEDGIAWPGLTAGTLRLKAAIIAIGGSTQAPPVTPAKAQGFPSSEKDGQHMDVIPEAVPEVPAERPAPEAEVHAPPLLERHKSPPPQHDPVQMQIVLNNCDQIIPNLYLGGIAAVSDPQLLVQQGIRAICCCVRELEFPTREFCPEVEYYRVDVEDISREPIELFFPEATEFIHSWMSREQPVLVHCRAGVSRSASCVIAYLMTYHQLSLHDAFFLVRSRRNIVTPNIGFMEKLGEYEEEVRNTEATIDINKYISWYTSPEPRAAVPDLKPD